MNTRLQVEHPVTELVHGVDLVEAAAHRRPRDGRSTLRVIGEPHGHAIEVRLYAEDPAARLAAAERVADAVRGPGRRRASSTCSTGHGVRLDSGFESGSEVSTHYDAMLAKVIAWAPTRARGRPASWPTRSRRAQLHGVVTNRDLLVAILRDEAFLDGRGQHRLLRPHRRASSRRGPAATRRAPAVRGRGRAGRAGPVARAGPGRRPGRVAQRRLAAAAHRVRRAASEEHVVEWYGGRDGYSSTDRRRARAGRLAGRASCSRSSGSATRVAAIVDAVGRRRCATSTVDGRWGPRTCAPCPRFVDPADVVAQGSLLAPMPGTVIGVPVEDGAEVTAGQTVLVLEAMKMQHTISAPTDGVVTDLVAVGQQVAAGDVLAVVPQRERRGERVMSSFTESEERQTLRREVREARVVVRPGVLHPLGPQPARRPPTCGSRSARPATSASTSPRSTAAVVAASVTSRPSARSSPRRAARC